jgi:hypothetical protein
MSAADERPSETMRVEENNKAEGNRKGVDAGEKETDVVRKGYTDRKETHADGEVIDVCRENNSNQKQDDDNREKKEDEEEPLYEFLKELHSISKDVSKKELK